MIVRNMNLFFASFCQVRIYSLEVNATFEFVYGQLGTVVLGENNPRGQNERWGDKALRIM